MENPARKNISSPSPFEPLRGYSRAVVIGNQLWISGTTATGKDGEIVEPGNPYLQTKHVISTLKSVLESEGFRLSDIVRTRMFVTKIKDWEAYARAHREAFDRIRPASSIVEVSRLTDARMVVEIEADAVKV